MVFLNDRNVTAILSVALGNQWRASSHTLGKVIQREQHPLLEARVAVAEMVARGGKHQQGGENLTTGFPSMREEPFKRASGYIKGNQFLRIVCEGSWHLISHLCSDPHCCYKCFFFFNYYLLL